MYGRECVVSSSDSSTLSQTTDWLTAWVYKWRMCCCVVQCVKGCVNSRTTLWLLTTNDNPYRNECCNQAPHVLGWGAASDSPIALLFMFCVGNFAWSTWWFLALLRLSSHSLPRSLSPRQQCMGPFFTPVSLIRACCPTTTPLYHLLNRPAVCCFRPNYRRSYPFKTLQSIVVAWNGDRERERVIISLCNIRSLKTWKCERERERFPVALPCRSDFSNFLVWKVRQRYSNLPRLVI